MRAPAMLTLFLIALGGCAAQAPQQVLGAFAPSEVALDNSRMAEDVAKKLAALYPPAHNQLNLRHPASDKFGTALIGALRTRGYALAEYSSAKPAPAARQINAIALAYLVDQPFDAGMYRVTVHVSSQSLTRLYQAREGVLGPAGYWMRKE